MVHDSAGGRYHLNLLLDDIRRDDDIAEILPFKGKERCHLRLHLHAVNHLRIYNPDLIQTSFLVILQYSGGNQTGAVHGGVLYRVMELLLHLDVSGLKIMASQFPHHIKPVVLTLFHPLLGHLQHVMVVSACQSLIAGYDYQSLYPVLLLNFLPGIEVKMLYIRHMTQDTAYQILKGIEVRLCFLQQFLTLLKLGGGNQVHGIGNLPGILDAFHTAEDFSCICHINSFFLVRRTPYTGLSYTGLPHLRYGLSGHRSGPWSPRFLSQSPDVFHQTRPACSSGIP